MLSNRQSMSATNSPSQDYTHPDDHTLPTYDMTPRFKPFTMIIEVTPLTVVGYKVIVTDAALLCIYVRLLDYLLPHRPKVHLYNNIYCLLCGERRINGEQKVCFCCSQKCFRKADIPCDYRQH